MTKKTRKPAQPPRPESQRPRDRRADKAGDPGVSFYGSVLIDEMREVLAEAGVIEGIDQEVAFLRFRLRGLLVNIVQNEPRILKVIELLIRAYAAKIRASGDSQDPDGKAIENMLREATDTLGLDRIPWNENA